MNQPVLKMLKIRGRDWEAYFAVLEVTKKGTYRGIQVDKEDSMRKPRKAAQKFIPIPRHGELGWQEISASEIPADVQKRFAEYA